MSVFARIVVGVDGTDWGFEAVRQALLLAPKEGPVDTAPAIHTGFQAGHLADLLANEAEEARQKAETITGSREGSERA